MKRRFILMLISFLFFPGIGLCQVFKNTGGSILFHGLVLDARTESPLPNSQIFINRFFSSVSDSEGKFVFTVNHNDTVIFRQLGYKPAVLHISDSLTGREFIAGVYLDPDTLTIAEVIIIPRLASLKADLFKPGSVSKPEFENAKYNLSVSAYQGRVSQNKLGDPATNYELLREHQRNDAYSKGQIPADRIAGISPLMLIPAAYLLLNGFPDKPAPMQPHLSDQELNQLHKRYLESLRKEK
jgi:hypothetical protein